MKEHFHWGISTCTVLYSQPLPKFWLKSLSHITDRTTDHRSGIIRVVSGIIVYTPGRHPGVVLGAPAYPGKLIFRPGVHGRKIIRYHSWKAPCSFCVATKYIREFRTRRMSVLIQGSRWLHGRHTVRSRSGTDHFSSMYSGTENCAGLIFYHGYAGAPRITPDACPVTTRWCRRR